ncbi:oligosaccharide flippase family protein [Grimontia indica]|uniref:oligosaccharide flippase family protein n=1 Tax=Grimontia indica TaxID=1056512 RepID=UPI001360B2CD|nr:oligosaccharide flippase family protein [Grimontia indica]
MLKNFSALSALQLYGLILPFIVYPYLIRTVGLIAYGEFVLYHSVAMIFVVTVAYGFDISAVNQISSGKEKKSLVLVRVIYAKFLIFLSILPIALIFFIIIDEPNYLLIFSLVIFVFSEILNLNWFYLSIEKSHINLYANVVIKTIANVLILIFINGSSDIWLYPLLLSIGNLSLGFSLLLFANYRVEKLSCYTSFSSVLGMIKKSNPFYISRLLVVCRERVAAIFIGISLGEKEVAFYDICLKIVNLLITPISVLNSAIYPKVSRDRSYRIVKFSILLSTLYSLFSIVIIGVLGSDIIYVLSSDDELSEMSFLLTLMSLSLIAQVFIYFLGNTYLVVEGLDREFKWSVVLSTLAYLLYIITLYKFSLLDLTNSISGLVLCYFMTAIHRVYYLFRKKDD